MSQRHSSGPLILLVCLYALYFGPDSLVWDAVAVTVMVLNAILMARSYIKGPQLTTEQRLEISRKKTAELEADLGMEPLNLHELDDILINHHNDKEDQS